MSLGPPVPVNPFWSETQRDEAILRACRPSHLPSAEVSQAPVAAVSPPREVPDEFKMMIHGLLQENSRLWSEREAFSNQGGWNQTPMSGGFQQSMLGGLLGDASGHGRNPLNALLEMFAWGQPSSQNDKGLLGALSRPVDRGGAWCSSWPEQGMFGGQTQAHRGNLMELFNLVSSASTSRPMHSRTVDEVH